MHSSSSPTGVSSGNGKKGKKGKDKKALKKQQQAERLAAMAESAAKLNNARFEEDGKSPRNVLVGFEPFCKFERNGLSLQMELFARGSGETSQTPADVCDFVYNLTETNMKEKYIEAGWGWNGLKKRRELEDEEARILVAKDTSTGAMVAFMHFRFERNDDALVLYVYELQVDQAAAARKGLGRQMMMLAELVGRKYGMEWVMLTVLNCNQAAGKFYQKLKYVVDETSPSHDLDDEDSAYTILSKELAAAAAKK